MGADTSSLKGAANTQKLAWMSNFSLGYVKKLKERFEFASDDFTLDREALKTYFKCSDRECQILFEHFDMDDNGKIDSYELTCALALLSGESLEDKAELLFSLYDYDGNKYLSQDELVILMTNVLAAMNSIKKLAPPSVQEIEMKTENFFAKADQNQDRKITLKEFKDYITTDKEILEVLINSNMAKREDLGQDFGSGETGVPDVDPDLEAECNPKELQQSRRKAMMKEGTDIEAENEGEEDSMFKIEEAGDGDQFMAVKPWMGVVKNSVPTNYKPNNRDGDAPDANLELEYIHGYRCHDARNNLRYTATGEVTYHAAAVGVVLNQKTNTQRFFIQHTDDVHCMAIDASGKFCATGQIGNYPTICVWNNETMECVARISGTLRKGIKNLAFSPDGRYLAASAFDDEHCIAVYSLNAKLKPGETIKPVATGKGTRANILSLGFNPLGNQLVATCVKEVNFYSFDNSLIKCKRGTGWTNNMQSVLCQAFLGETLYTGLFDGNLVSWNGTAIKSSMKAHVDGVHALSTRPNQAGLISGGGDGLIIFWSPGPGGVLQQTKQIDIKVPEVKSMMPKVRSVCENATNGMILVGTRGGEIVEFGGPKPNVLMRSHFDGELWGLATHPLRQEYVTVGQDNVLAIWDIKTRKQKRFGRLEQAANVIAYSNNGTFLAVGYINGAFHVLEPDNKFTLKANVKNRNLAISEIKFNPDDSLMAVGAHDMMIVVYGVKQNFQRLKVMKGHTSTVTHFDWSLDGKIIMSNCTSYSILFFDTVSGKHNPSGASAFKNETWYSWSCTLGWPVQGIFPPAADGSDINACDRSPEGTVLATADDFGKVKLFRYPCPVPRGQFVEFRGHSSHVTNCRFLKNTPYLISTGGNDKSIFQWKYIFDKESSNQSKLTNQVVPGKATTNINDDIAGPPKLRAPLEEQKKPQTTNVGGMFQIEETGDGDQAMAIKPFLGQVTHSTPAQYTNPKSLVNEKPEGKLELKYAHGFRSFDTRGNLKYINQNEIAFSTAALGVVLNKSTNTQKFFNLHEEDVVAMAIHPSKQIIATGQMAAKGKSKLIDIFVWNVATQEVLSRLNNFHRGAIRKLEFSPAGDKLLTIGEDEQNSVAIYDWANKRMLCKSAVDPDKVLDACWKDETEFATCGIKHVKFFTLNGINLTMSRGLYGQAGATPTICCKYAFNDKVMLTGSPTGELQIWAGRTLSKSIKAHTEAMWQIININGGSLIITGGNDGKLIFWDRQFLQKQVIDLVPMSKFPTGVRSLDYLEQSKTILVGTKGAEIIEVNQVNGQKIKTLIHGHFAGTPQAELWGCAVHPKEQLFASCGADKTIRIWKDNVMVQASVQFEQDLTALDWSSNGQFLVVGDRNGFIHLVDPKTLTALGNSPANLAGKKDAWIEDLKISPNCQMVAFGTHGGRSFIDLVKVVEGKKLQKVKSVNLGLSSALTHLDWTLDSTTLIINSQAYELMWMNVSTFAQVPASSAKSMGDDYATFTGCFGWQVKGIWRPFSDFTDVNSTCRAHSRNFLATADDFGQVNVYKYPCTVEKAIHASYLGHSSHVTKVKFSADDRYLISTGGHDKTVLIWENQYGAMPISNENDEEPVVYIEEEVKGQDNKNNFHIDEDDCEDFTAAKTECPAKLLKQATKRDNRLKSTVKAKIDDVVVDNPFFQVESAGDGDEFQAIKPWVGQIKAPSDFRKPKLNQNKPPQIGFDLEWVHGYRSQDSRNNIGILADNSFCYPAAALGIAYDPFTGVQRFFNNHIDDVTAISFSPDKRFVATGEIGPKPMICIWDAITMQPKHVIKGKLTKGIQALSFSPSGKSLAAVAIDPDHSVAVYNVDTGALIGFAKGDVNQILDISMKNDTTFATSGIKHFKEWTVGANLTAKTGRFGQKDARHGACQYNGELCLSGAITGELYIWAAAAIKDAKKLHDKPLDAIHVSSSFVLTGGKDMKVNVLQKATYALLFSFPVDPSWNSICGKVRALCLNTEENKLLVGTLGSEIYQVDFKAASKQIGAPTLLVDGHYSPCLKDTNEVWGLSVFKNSNRYVSVSDDGYLMIWNSAKKTCEFKLDLTLDESGQPFPLDPATGELSNQCKARSIDISSNGELAAIGFRNGSVRVYSTDDWSLLKSWVVTDNKLSPMIQDLKFSPNNQYLAISCHDAKIYIYDANTLNKKAVCKASTSAVTHIDWSLDSQNLHSNDLSYEVLYYTANTGQQNLGGATVFKDEMWATYTVPLGWPSQGIWPPRADGSDVNSVDRSNNFHPDGYQLIATGDDFSKVKIFRYPSSEEGSQGLVGKGHSSHVTNVKFASNDQYLYSTGGNDTCVFRWKIRNSVA